MEYQTKYHLHKELCNLKILPKRYEENLTQMFKKWFEETMHYK
jgi:hypothetical protein